MSRRLAMRNINSNSKWIKIAFILQILFYGLPNYLFAPGEVVDTALTGLVEPYILGLSKVSFGIGITAMIIFTLCGAINDANFNTENNSIGDNKRILLNDKTPLLEDHKDNDKKEEDVITTIRMPPKLKWYQQIILGVDHYARVTDFSTPLLFIAAAKYSDAPLWAIDLIAGGSIVIGIFSAKPTCVSSRDNVRELNREIQDEPNQDTPPKKITATIIIAMIGEVFVGFANYAWGTGKLIDTVTRAKPVVIGLSLSGLCAGVPLGTLCVATLMYTNTIMRKHNQSDEATLTPLTTIQKLIMAGAAGAIVTDNSGSLIFLYQLANFTNAPWYANAAASFACVGFGVGTSIADIQASIFSWRERNAREQANNSIQSPATNNAIITAKV